MEQSFRKINGQVPYPYPPGSPRSSISSQTSYYSALGPYEPSFLNTSTAPYPISPTLSVPPTSSSHTSYPETRISPTAASSTPGQNNFKFVSVTPSRQTQKKERTVIDKDGTEPCRLHFSSLEKRFKCEKCDKRFKQKGNMKTHMRMHTGTETYLRNAQIKSVR